VYLVGDKYNKMKSFPSRMDPVGGADLRFYSQYPTPADIMREQIHCTGDASVYSILSFQ